MAKGSRGGKRRQKQDKFYVKPPENNAMDRNKSYEVKPWFASKVANEVKHNISMCDVFAVMKGTEKAVYAVLNLGTYRKKTMWVPKSALIQNNIGYNYDSDTNYYKTLFISDYDEAVKNLIHIGVILNKERKQKNEMNKQKVDIPSFYFRSRNMRRKEL